VFRVDGRQTLPLRTTGKVRVARQPEATTWLGDGPGSFPLCRLIRNNLAEG
jgi:hypothetical protein